MRRIAAAIVAATALALVPGTARGAVPRDFFGVMADGPLVGSNVNLAREARLMGRSGVGSIRVAVYWSSIQPWASAADAPPELAGSLTDMDGVPSITYGLDRVVAAAARRGMTVLPVVLRTPAWARDDPADEAAPPSDPASYARFATSLVHRYGPRGRFWDERPELPRVPVRRWQVWNEPDIDKYWSRQPWAPTYVALLRAGAAAIRAADPGAQVVLAGLTNRSWEDLDLVYRAGGRAHFDLAAAHPFSRQVTSIVKIVALVRGTMARHGDAAKPVLLTEVSWSSGKGRSTLNYGWEVTERGQAVRVRQTLTALARAAQRLRIAGVYWYTWLSPRPGRPDSFSYSGLRRQGPGRRIVSKPALLAFAITARRLTAR